MTKDFLKKFMAGDNDIVRIHISHDDLDGFACHMVTQFFQHGNSPKKNICMINIPIPAALNLSLDTVFNNFHDSFKNEVMILITDIGGINLSDLITEIQRLRDMHGVNENLKVEVCIIDHHINPLFDNCDEFDSKYDVKRIHEYVYASYSNENNTICYSNTHEYSAAYILYLESRLVSSVLYLESMTIDGNNIFKDDPKLRDKIYRNNAFEEFIKAVSLWDTGNFGFYSSYDESEIDLQAFWNLVFSYFTMLDNISFVTSGNNYLARTALIKTLTNSLFACADNLQEVAEPYNDIVRYKLKELNDNYNQFMDIKAQEFDLMKSMEDGFILVKISETDSIKVLLPQTVLNMEELGNVSLDKMTIEIFKDTEEFNIYSYSVYAQRYLKESNCAITMRVNYHSSEDISIDMRSYIDGISVQQIATANGGGGHPHAAGFSVTVKDQTTQEKE